MAVEVVLEIVGCLQTIKTVWEECRREDAEIGKIAVKIEAMSDPIKTWARSKELPLSRGDKQLVRALMFSILWLHYYDNLRAKVVRVLATRR